MQIERPAVVADLRVHATIVCTAVVWGAANVQPASCSAERMPGPGRTEMSPRQVGGLRLEISQNGPLTVRTDIAGEWRVTGARSRPTSALGKNRHRQVMTNCGSRGTGPRRSASGSLLPFTLGHPRAASGRVLPIEEVPQNRPSRFGTILRAQLSEYYVQWGARPGRSLRASRAP